ncbi:MAG: tRNA 5-hydroxyuridine modification protein YegQ [Candidatus Dasytiphilus stammeri]
MLKPELLSPAGTLKNMRYCFAYGADAVYAGPPRYSLRVRNNEFSYKNLEMGINEAHIQKKKFYIVINISPHNSKIKTLIKDLKSIIDLKPDALIVSDPGVIMLIQDSFPTIPIHLSVQANAVNWATVSFWHKMGLKRIILSRELSLEEIEQIHERVPEIELEVFVHGAICMAYSGRCLLSTYINKRDSNQGACTNNCRWKYKVQEGKEDEIGNIIISNPSKTNNKLFLIKQTQTESSDIHPKEEYMTSFEDEHGTYIFNSKDLRAIRHVERLIKIGIHSFKIEGRTKSFYYCARTTQIYRNAIDDAIAGKPFNHFLLEMLNGLSHRGYTEGFLSRHHPDDLQNYYYSHSVSNKQKLVGEFTGERRGELAQIAVKNKFYKGDSVQIISPQRNVNLRVRFMENNKSQSITIAPGDGHLVWIPIPTNLDLDFALLILNLFPHSPI